LTLSTVCELPFGRGRRWLKGRLPAYVVGGWTTGVLTTFQPGAPLSATTLTNTASAFSAGNLRPNVLHDLNLAASVP